MKFLLEGNRENQGLVESLEAREVASGGREDEVLKGFGLEARVGEGGRVRLVETQRDRERGAKGSAGVQQAGQAQATGQAKDRERRRSMGSVGTASRSSAVDLAIRGKERMVEVVEDTGMGIE